MTNNGQLRSRLLPRDYVLRLFPLIFYGEKCRNHTKINGGIDFFMFFYLEFLAEVAEQSPKESDYFSEWPARQKFGQLPPVAVPP